MNEELQHLIEMANQIAANNNRGGEQQCAAVVENHIRQFWARPMKQKIISYLEQDGEQLLPATKIGLQAIIRLRDQ